MVDARITVGLLWLTVLPGIPLLIFLLRDVPFIWGLATFALLPILYAVIQRALRVLLINNLRRRAVFITGCDTGFGNLLALKCVKRGMPVFAGCLTEKGAQSLKSAAVGFTGKLETIIIDVSSDESVTNAAKYLEQATVQYGGLHGLVNNAGFVGASFFDDLLNVEQYKAVADVNTFGTIRVTQALKHLVKKTRGRIVTMSSAAARVGALGTGPYTVSKFAVSGYCEVIRQELRYFGVSVHVLEPGMFQTPMTSEESFKTRFAAMWVTAPATVKQEYGEHFFREFTRGIADAYTNIGSPRLDLVVDAYFHALTARFPNLRYQCGFDAQFILLPISYLPTGLRDAIFTVSEMMIGVPVPLCAQNGDQARKMQ